MTVYAFTSTRGAPGVTTTALGLTLHWPKPVILLEADVSGSSSVLAGYLRGHAPRDRSLVNLALAHRTGQLGTTTLREEALALDDEQSRLLIPGIVTAAQAAGLNTGFWEALGSVLQSMHRVGFDVLVDAGRLGMAAGPSPLVRAVDLAVIVTRTQLDPLINLKAHEIVNLTASGLTGIVTIGPGQPYTNRQIAKLTDLPVWADISDDRVHAEVLSTGREHDSRRFSRSGLVRSLRSVAETLQATHHAYRQRLNPTSAEGTRG